METTHLGHGRVEGGSRPYERNLRIQDTVAVWLAIHPKSPKSAISGRLLAGISGLGTSGFGLAVRFLDCRPNLVLLDYRFEIEHRSLVCGALGPQFIQHSQTLHRAAPERPLSSSNGAKGMTEEQKWSGAMPLIRDRRLV
jgi:hypothetical protein